MGNTYLDPDDYDSTEEENQAPVAPAQPAPVLQPPQAASPLPNPVIRSFDSPAQPAANTVPQATASAAPTVQPPQPSQPPAALYVPPAPPAIPPQAPGPVRFQYTPGVTPPDPQPDEEDQRAQYARDQAASLRFHKSQGGQTEVLPTGQEQIKTDAAGNALYHPAVVQPFFRNPEDGKGYRVSRDEYNNEHHFDLAQGAEGQDFHVDPANGQMYVDVSGADGSSKREVIGQNPYVPKIQALGAQLQAHSAISQQLDLSIAQATHGVQGGTPLQAASLQDLREQASTLARKLTLNENHIGLVRVFEERSKARDSTIADAQQQRDNVVASRQQITRQLGVLQAARRGRMNLQQDLATVAGGGLIDENQSALLANAGLIVPDTQADGSRIMRVSREAAGLLDADTQKALKANPDQFNVMSSATPEVAASVKAMARQLPKAENEDTSKVLPAEVVQARQRWQTVSQNLMRNFPGIGVAGSPQNVAFVRAFRASSGDVQKALAAAQRQN